MAYNQYQSKPGKAVGNGLNADDMFNGARARANRLAKQAAKTPNLYIGPPKKRAATAYAKAKVSGKAKASLA